MNVTRMYHVCCKKDDAVRLVVQMCRGKKAVIWNDFQCRETSSNFSLMLNEILLEYVLESRLESMKCFLGLQH